MAEEVIVVGDPKSRKQVVEFGEEEVYGEERVRFGFEVGGTAGTYLVIEDYWTGGREVFEWEEVVVSEPWTPVYHNPTRQDTRKRPGNQRDSGESERTVGDSGSIPTRHRLRSKSDTYPLDT